LFSVIAFPHRDDAPRIPAWGPNHRNHSPAEVSDRLHPDFTVITPPINDIERAASKDVPRIGEVDRSLDKGFGSLGAIERDLHVNYRTPGNNYCTPRKPAVCVQITHREKQNS
jgi:hypothetical protein